MKTIYDFLQNNLNSDYSDDELITIESMILNHIENGKTSFNEIKELMFNILVSLSCNMLIITQPFLVDLHKFIEENFK